MDKKLYFIIFVIFLASSSVYAMGTAPTAPTQEVGGKATASEEALAKEQIENLRNISINSKTVQEGYDKFVNDVMSGKMYLYEFNDMAKKELTKDALNKKQDWKYRFAIIGSLHPDNPPEMFDIRRNILEDKSENIELRRYAIQRIADTKRETKKLEAVDILIRALKDNDWDIVASAANGSGKLRNKKAVEPLIESVKRTRVNIDKLLNSGWKGYKKGTQPEESALSCSIRALGEIGDNRAVPVLIDLLNDPYLEQVVEMNDGTKGWAIIALRKINDERAIGPIREYLKTTRDYRVGEVASDALQKMIKEKKDNEKGIKP